MPTKEGNKWRGTKMIRGKRRSKMFNSKTEARKWEAAQTEEAWLKESTTPTVSVVEWGTEYLHYAKAQYAKSTFDDKRRALKRLTMAFGANTLVRDLPPLKVEKHFREIHQNGGSASNDRKYLKAAWTWGKKRFGFNGDNPFDVDIPPARKRDRYIPPLEDFWKVLKAVQLRQDQVMLLTYLYTAARRTEVFRLKWSDIDFTNARIRLGTKKRASHQMEYDWIPMAKTLTAELADWKNNRPHKDSEHVFVISGEHHFENQYEGSAFKVRGHFMNKACKRAGVKAFGFHSIRHLTASVLAQENESLPNIKQILRHKNVATTARYIHSLIGADASIVAALPEPPEEVLSAYRAEPTTVSPVLALTADLPEIYPTQ